MLVATNLKSSKCQWQSLPVCRPVRLGCSSAAYWTRKDWEKIVQILLTIHFLLLSTYRCSTNCDNNYVITICTCASPLSISHGSPGNITFMAWNHSKLPRCHGKKKKSQRNDRLTWISCSIGMDEVESWWTFTYSRNTKISFLLRILS